MKPDAIEHNPDPAYIRQLVLATGMSKEQVAARIGISLRSLDYYMSDRKLRIAPYAVQYCLEQLINHGKPSQ